MSSSPRYAIYYAPRPDSALGRFGTSWLGRDVDSGQPVCRPSVAGFSSDDLAACITEPQRYGFHATLKAPFRLAADKSEYQLIERLKAFSESYRPFTIPTLVLADLAGFLALIPSQHAPALNALAAASVQGFDDFRAPPTAPELERRQPARLSERQREFLSLWGYPYVMDEYRFHMTLTDKLDDGRRAKLMAVLAPLVAPLIGTPPAIDGITLFVQPEPNAPFMVAERFPFQPVSRNGKASAPTRGND